VPISRTGTVGVAPNISRVHDPAVLSEAKTHVTAARAFFVDGSDYQTERCDDLLTKIKAAEAARP
jgi:hypothetical protein